jgi:hypothetical protein
MPLEVQSLRLLSRFRWTAILWPHESDDIFFDSMGSSEADREGCARMLRRFGSCRHLFMTREPL